MLLRKRKLIKDSRAKKFKFAFGLILFLSGFLVIAIYFYINFYLDQYKYINPVWHDKNSPVYSIEEELQFAGIKFEKVSQNSDSSITTNLHNGAVVIFSSKKNFSGQIASLQLMLSRLTIEGKKLKQLDFRYANPVASF